MKTDVRHEADITVVAVSETIDALTAPELTRTLGREMADGRYNLVVDLTGIDFMSSAGLRTLLGGVKEARTRGGDLRIASVNPGIDRVLRMSGFYSIAKVFPSASEALASFSA